MSHTLSLLDRDPELAKVNPLYGPGTMLGWYFTIMAVIISRTLNPQQRRSDSLTVDLTAVLTLPGVALVHFINLIRHQESWRIRAEPPLPISDHWDDSLRSQQFAAYAPFVVMRVFLPMSLVLYNTSSPMVFVKVSSFVIFVAFACANLILMFSHLFIMSNHWLEGPSYRKGSPIQIDWLTLLVPALWCGLFALIILPCVVVDNFGLESDTSADLTEPIRPYPFMGGTEPLFTDDRSSHIPTSIESRLSTYNFTILQVYVFVSMMIALQGILLPTQSSGSWLSKVLTFFIPPSNSSLNDLDQIVTACAGASVLLFNLYSAASARYKYRIEQRRLQIDPEADETTPLTSTTSQVERPPQRERPTILSTEYELEALRSHQDLQSSDRNQSSEHIARDDLSPQPGNDSLPAETSPRTQRSRANLHVHWADQEALII